VGLIDERVRYLHLICDGTHVHPVMVRLVVRARGAGAICLVTDAIVRAGCDDGPYTNDDGRTFNKKGGVGRTDTGWLCGSGLLLPDHLRLFMKFTGLPPEEAIRTVTGNPADSLGLGDRIGFLRPGLSADFVAWDHRMRVRRVWRAGREVKPISEFAEVTL
jgi:N-acetylglucosamine-6-phosphate deacetylase